MDIRIDIDSCVGCGICKEICSVDAIQMAYAGMPGYEYFNSIMVRDRCIGCGDCIEWCPVGAIWDADSGSPWGGSSNDWQTDIGGGGGSSPENDDADLSDVDYQTGIMVIDSLEGKILDNNVCVYEVDHLTGAILSSTSLALAAKSEGLIVIDVLRASDPLIKSIGKVVGGAGVSVSAVQAIIGVVKDGEINKIDWVNAAAAATQGAALLTIEIPPVAIALGIISIGFTIYSSYLSICDR